MGVAYSVGEVDHLYTFFVQWSPDIYTKDAKKHHRPRYLIREKSQNRFLVVEQDKVAVINQLLSNPINSTANSWEIITVNDSNRRPSICSSEESEVEEPEDHKHVVDVLPFLSDHSQLLDEPHLEHLAPEMPARTEGSPWQLVYSTAVHGTSLKTLYRNMADYDSPVLLAIKDMHNRVFGAFSSHPFRLSNYCYGTGETFLYSFSPDFKAYRWSGENNYFVKGHVESLQIGGGGGVLGLWLDADLYRGSSCSCPTFNNLPLSTQQDFVIQDLEVWAVQN